MAQQPERRGLWWAIQPALWAAVAVSSPARAVEPEGIVREAEDIAEPNTAWRVDQRDPNFWTLWTKEEDIQKKRSRGAVMASPTVPAERKTPEEGAPPLHCVVKDLKPGLYHVYVSPPGRPLAYSLNGKRYSRYEGGELYLGLRELPAGRFEIWIDDKYPSPGNPGSGYFDYVRFVPARPGEKPSGPPRIENLAAWSPQSGTVHLCWTTNRIAPSGEVDFGPAGEEPKTTPAGSNQGRNHRAILEGLDLRKTYLARVRTDVEGAEVLSEEVRFAAAPATPAGTRPFVVPLIVAEPTGLARQDAPAVIGVPFARGALARVEDLRLTLDGRAVPAQIDLFSRWPDGSVKWAVVSFLAGSGKSPVEYRLEARGDWPAAPQLPAVLKVEETPDAWCVRTDALAFDIPRPSTGSGRVPALFYRVGWDRNGDGKIADDERIAAQPLGANLKLELADGSFCTCGTPTEFRAEANGANRAVLKLAGPLVDANGPRGWSYLVRITLWRGRPEMAVNVSIVKDSSQPAFERINFLALRVPLDGDGGVRGALDGGPPGVPDAQGLLVLRSVPSGEGAWILQDDERHFTIRTDKGLTEGERASTGSGRPERVDGRAVGVAAASDARSQVIVAIRDFWQAYPSGLAVKGDGIHVRLLPALPADAYTDADSKGVWGKLYSWCREGKYLFRAGQLAQKEFLVRYGSAGERADARAIAAWYQAPLLPQAPPAYLCATGVLGRAIYPRTPGVWDSYETFFDGGFAGYRRDRQTERTYGWMHFGDWYGERQCNYGNNEYDTTAAFATQWFRTGDRDQFEHGLQMARHHSTVDTLHGAPAAARSGLVYEHSFNHVGTDLEADSPLLKGADVGAYLQKYGRSMFRGAIDRQGHVFQPGNWMYAALTGDPFLRDVAERVCLNQAAMLTPNFDFGIERSGGWPLINMAAAYNFSGNPYYLNAARLMVERCLQRQDPNTGGWLHTPPIDETGGVKVLGGKAFAVGILTHGILRYLEQEPQERPDVQRMLVRATDWLMRESWLPGKGYRYITNAPNLADKGSRGGTSCLNCEAIAFAYEATKDPNYLAFWKESMAGAFDKAAGGMGKSFSQLVRQTIFALDRMQAFGVNSAPAQAQPATGRTPKEISTPADIRRQTPAKPAGTPE